MHKKPLALEKLNKRCNPEKMAFESTTEIAPLSRFLGQDQALESLEFGLSISQQGYNMFVMGPTGVGKHTMVRQVITEYAKNLEPPADWCYIYNFDNPRTPRSLQLPSGKGIKLRRDMEKSIQEINRQLYTAFASDDYHFRQKAIEAEQQTRLNTVLKGLDNLAEKKDIAILQTSHDYSFSPIKEGEVLSNEAVALLPVSDRDAIKNEIAELQKELEKINRKKQKWLESSRQKIQTLNQKTAKSTISPLLRKLSRKYSEFKELVQYFNDIQQDILDNLNEFLKQSNNNITDITQHPLLKRFQVNVLNEDLQRQGAPIVYEDLPSYKNLLGRIEHMAQMGVLLSDYNLIKCGSLHNANGGYLIIDAEKLFQQPHSWNFLKRALRSQQIKIETLDQQYSWVSTVSLQPESIPLKVKIILLGTREKYCQLFHSDPDFAELFKVQVHFQQTIDRTTENEQFYLQLVSKLVSSEKMLHLDKYALARVIEYSSRLVGDSGKLSIHMSELSNLLREASHWGKQNHCELISENEIFKAIESKVLRGNFIKQHLHQSIHRGSVFIDTDSRHVGQINGLLILTTGNYTFGRPSRITATTRLGSGNVVDIEREVDLGGDLHSKGVFILSSYLGWRYARSQKLSLTASFTFEQSYGKINGDSASLAELCAILSSLSEVPIKQSFAVTGSINQLGVVQPIGGVNEKIEGFFDICKVRGLNGEHSVIIPKSNVKNLMLCQEVLDAVEQKLFHIYAVETVNDAIEILTSIDAGLANEVGDFPVNSLNYRVVEKLTMWAKD
ncbi:MAG: AAA family ATPase [Methylococcales bacterium]|jgi:lon-related putative ATP-dependent protease|nr:AAA family ATPase [Methylococcales bacterium]